MQRCKRNVLLFIFLCRAKVAQHARDPPPLIDLLWHLFQVLASNLVVFDVTPIRGLVSSDLQWRTLQQDCCEAYNLMTSKAVGELETLAKPGTPGAADVS